VQARDRDRLDLRADRRHGRLRHRRRAGRRPGRERRQAIYTELGLLQFPPAAANAMVLLAAVVLMIAALTRIIDVRKEL
jgi:hypothetical protein